MPSFSSWGTIWRKASAVLGRRMTDNHIGAVFLRPFRRFPDHGGNGCHVGFIIYEKIISYIGHAVRGCCSVGSGGGIGAAVEEEEMTMMKLIHHHLHGVTVRGGLGALMIIDAHRFRHLGKGTLQKAPDFLIAHGSQDDLGFHTDTGNRFHRLVKNHRKAMGMPGQGGVPGVHLIRHDGQGKRDAQGFIDMLGCQVPSCIIDDDGQLSFYC